MNKIITDNILDIQEGIICHQVNCQRVAGAGLALQIRNKWPEWYEQYTNLIQPYMGSIFITNVTPRLLVASLYAQYGYGTKQRHTDYGALLDCLKEVALYIPPVYIPYGIGCGLAGGDWNIVSGIIEKTIPNAVIVKLP